MSFVSYWINGRLEYAELPPGKTADEFLRLRPGTKFNGLHATEEQAKDEVEYEMDLAWNSY